MPGGRSDCETFCLGQCGAYLCPVQQPRRGRARSEAARAAILRATRDAFAGYAGQPGTVPLLRAAAAAESDEVATRLYEHVTSVAQEALAGRIRAACLVGQIPASSPAAPALLAQSIIGAVLYRLLTRLPLNADVADDLIDAAFASASPAGRQRPPAGELVVVCPGGRRRGSILSAGESAGRSRRAARPGEEGPGSTRQGGR